jgi:SHAQKYF class myb-like DNA-binding protein
MRKLPASSCNNDDTGIALRALGYGAKSVQNGAEIARRGTRPAYEDCTVDGFNLFSHFMKSSIGDTKTSSQQAPCQRMPYFIGAMPKTANATQASKPTASTGLANSFGAESSFKSKRLHGMNHNHRKSRMVWSDELHNQFLRALTDIGLRHAVPKFILQVNSARWLSPTSLLC